MNNCKNCKYTDEYCASGECTSQNDLTEQYKHGNLPDDRLYYYRFKGEPEVQITTQYGLYCEEADNKKEIEVIDFVPSYEEYEQLENWNRFTADYHALREAKEISEYEKVELMEKVKQLKEQINHLLKTQARQFVDNQKLQVKAEKAKDVVNIDTARQIKQLKELLKECKDVILDYNNWIMSASPKDSELMLRIDEVLK